jgi:two-component system sensor histidine kinase ChiS
MNGSEALKIIENESLDLVLLDIMMPKMSGYEVCREIRKKHLASELPVIMITAKDQVTDLMEGLASGANDYLAKPFSKNELLARLRTHLNLYNITSAYLRFIPKELIKALGHESIIDVRLGDQARGEMSILFSDIRSFTAITEKLDAKESFEFLNNYLNCITPAITANNGFIDKYIGDAVMALFPYKTDDAVNAAIEAQKNLAEYNRERKKEGNMPIKIGIGLHTGPLMIGTIGVEDRMDGTVISDAVNLASRLEELNKHYGTSMIISEETLNKLNNPENYHYRFLSKVSVKGRQQSNKIFEFFDGDSEHDLKMKTETLEMFNKGIEEYYSKQFSKASVYFQQILEVYPEDRTAKIFLVNCAKYMVEGVPDDWDGVDIVEKVF